MTDQQLSALARRLADEVAAHRGQRVALDELRRMLQRIDPASQTSADRRRRLADALAELAAAGLVQLSKAVDDTQRPALPRFLTRPRPTPPRPARPSVVWHPELAWAAGLRTTPAQRDLLASVNRWLFGGGPAAAPAPLHERALEITGDEKALDGGSLLAPGRLTLDTLRAYRVVLPLHTVRLGAGPDLLVVENSDTFDSLRRVLAAGPGPVGRIGWGAGAAFEASVLSVAELDPVPAGVRYFGDLDAAGLRIPASASRLAVGAGLPAVRPATGLYAALVAVGVPQPGRAVTGDRLADLLGWLDDDLREPVGRLLAGGHRLAQEALSRARLTALRDQNDLVAYTQDV